MYKAIKTYRYNSMPFYGTFYSVVTGQDQPSCMKGVGENLLKDFWQTCLGKYLCWNTLNKHSYYVHMLHTHTYSPGGTGRSAKFTFLPALCALMASWYCCNKGWELVQGMYEWSRGKPHQCIANCSKSTHFIRTSFPLQGRYHIF